MKKKWVQNSLNLVLKAAVLAIALTFLLQRFDFSHIKDALSQPLYHPWLISFLFTGLWAINLFIDAYFWKKVHLMLEEVSISRGLKINLICYALSFITPANSGEWAGRYVMMGEPGNRKKSFFLNFWMHLPRLFAKLLIATLSAGVILYLYGMELWMATGITGAIFVTVFLIYFSFKRFQRWLQLKSIGSLQLENYLIKGRPDNREKFLFLLLAGAKFITYNLQFALALLLFSPDGLPYIIWFAIPVYYLIGSLLPSFALVDFILKSAVAIWVFQPILNNEALLILSSVIIWFFNIVIPSFAGFYVIMKTNLFRSFKKKFSRGILNGL